MASPSLETHPKTITLYWILVFMDRKHVICHCGCYASGSGRSSFHLRKTRSSLARRMPQLLHELLLTSASPWSWPSEFVNDTSSTSSKEKMPLPEPAFFLFATTPNHIAFTEAKISLLRFSITLLFSCRINSSV